MNQEPRVNERIRIPSLRVIDEHGEQLGILPTADALRLAHDRGLDLVEVAPNSVPPVARLLDYGQYKYEQARHERDARRSQRGTEVKEVQLKLRIGPADLETKAKRAAGFLTEGHRVRLVLKYRGREITHAELGRAVMDRFMALVGPAGAPERPAALEGKALSVLLVPAKR